MDTLVIYGGDCGWSNFESNVFLPHLKDKIKSIKIFKTISELNVYLEGEGKKNINYVIPLTDRHCQELNTEKIPALIPNSEVLIFFSDKQLFTQYVKINNLTNYYPEVFTAPNVSKKLVVVKPNFGGASTNVYFTELNKLKPQDFINNTVQEYIHSNLEFAGYFVANKGEIIHSFGYYREYPPGPYIKAINDKTVQKRTIIDKYYVKIIEKFVKPVSYTGAFCVDFKLAKNTLIVMEINPRLGASLSYPENIKDGADVIRCLINIYKDKIIEIKKNKKTSKTTDKIVNEERVIEPDETIVVNEERVIEPAETIVNE